jgi:hypothetical protein
VSAENEQAAPKTPAELEAAIAARRAHLADTVDELVARAQPRAIARRSAAGVKARLVSATRTEDGELRSERIAAVAGALLAIVALLMLVGRRKRRRTQGVT